MKKGKVDAKKVAEDKTFGMKNKSKSKKVQQLAKQAEASFVNAAQSQKSAEEKAKEKAREEAKKQKADKERMEKEMLALLRASIKQPPLEPGVDPKTVLCEFFKRKCCDKGDKCKFSHDLNIGKKVAARIDLYADRRDEKTDNMADWDQEKLESVVKSKHGANGQPQTDIVCKYFLDAIEKELYGWFWVCPNGGEACKYRHALPPGFVLKTRREREAEAAAALERGRVEVDYADLVEKERMKLDPSKCTKVTEETFNAWRVARDKRRAEAAANTQSQESNKKKSQSGKEARLLSGRALFAADPSMFVDDANADADAYVMREPEDDEEEEKTLKAKVGEGPSEDTEGNDTESNDKEEGDE